MSWHPGSVEAQPAWLQNQLQNQLLGSVSWLRDKQR